MFCCDGIFWSSRVILASLTSRRVSQVTPAGEAGDWEYKENTMNSAVDNVDSEWTV